MQEVGGGRRGDFCQRCGVEAQEMKKSKSPGGGGGASLKAVVGSVFLTWQRCFCLPVIQNVCLVMITKFGTKLPFFLEVTKKKSLFVLKSVFFGQV